MPCTPMDVRAWRTSSSLNGLMIATTSFMVAPFDFRSRVGVAVIARQLRKSDIFSRKKAQETCRFDDRPVRPVKLVTCSRLDPFQDVGLESSVRSDVRISVAAYAYECQNRGTPWRRRC